MDSSEVSVGLAQITATPFAVEVNLQATLTATDKAFQRGADIVVLPEMIIHGYVADRDGLSPLAEAIDGPSTAAWSALAERYDGYVVGGFCERDGDDLFNTAVLVGPDGVLLHYRKAHLFDQEKTVFTPGDLGFPVATTRLGTIGLCVCYDLRFVEVVRLLALQGADLICVPTAWVPGYDQERWDENGMCPQARGAVLQANLSQVFIACASQAGQVGGLDFLGSSCIADPYGKLADGPLPGADEAITVTTIDLEDAARAQTRSPLITPRVDRRTDLYGISLGDRVL